MDAENTQAFCDYLGKPLNAQWRLIWGYLIVFKGDIAWRHRITLAGSLAAVDCACASKALLLRAGITRGVRGQSPNVALFEKSTPFGLS